jgi:hypothetical protein
VHGKPARADAGVPAVKLDSGLRDPAEVMEYPGLSEFYNEISTECTHGDEPMTTVDMQMHAMTVERCANRKRALLERQLPGAFAKKRPRRDAFLNESCFVSDLLNWSDGSRWSYGTKRPVDVGTCFAAGAVAELYFTRALKQQQVAQYSEYVRFEQAPGARALALLENIEAGARKLERLAPEEAGAENACASFCLMFDADYRQVVRVVNQLRQDSISVADQHCTIWPQLEQELGGAEDCRSKLRLALLSDLDLEGVEGVDTKFWRTGTRDDADPGAMVEPAKLPPPKDSPYAQFADGVYARCEPMFRSPAADRSADSCFRATLAGEFKTLAERVTAAQAFTKTWQRFGSALCAVEDHVGAAFSWDFYGQRWPSGKPNCEWRMAVQGAFLADRWLTGDAAGLFEHMQYRQSWVERVHQGFDLLKVRTESPPCKVGEYPPDVNCRTRPEDSSWRRVLPDVNALNANTRATAESLCGTWAELAAVAPSTCTRVAENYLLSLGSSIGLIPLIEEKK